MIGQNKPGGTVTFPNVRQASEKHDFKNFLICSFYSFLPRSQISTDIRVEALRGMNFLLLKLISEVRQHVFRTKWGNYPLLLAF